MIPGHSRYVIVGAGIHGLSTAWHLAGELRRRGVGGGEDILVLDKRGVGAGASGIACGVTVTGIGTSGGAVTAVETDQGVVGCEQLVIAAGPWVRDLWAMLGQPSHIPVTTPDGTVHDGQPMWTYWALQEGTLAVDPGEFTTNEGTPPPVVHVDSDAPLYDHH